MLVPFSSLDMHANTHKILWKKSEDLSATPYVVLSTKRFNCHHGFDRNSAAKKKHFEAKEIQVKMLLSFQLISLPSKFKLTSAPFISEVGSLAQSRLCYNTR